MLFINEFSPFAIPNHSLISMSMQSLIYFILFYLGLSVKIIALILGRESLGGAKTGDPREKSPDHPEAELGLSHM